MNESDPRQRHDASAWGTWVALVLALSPLLYVLSIGPAGWLEKEGYLPRSVRSVYAPVIWLHDHTPLEKPLEWYGNLWGWK
jgi:hypothetical protein